jgi:hypothetical protein
MMPRHTPGMPILRTYGLLAFAYVLFGTCGLLIFVVAAPSTSLARQGGLIITIIWGLLCLIGGLLGVIGLLARRMLVELIGASMMGVAWFTWSAALVLQAVSTRSAVPLTAACLALGVTALIAQRWADARRPQD